LGRFFARIADAMDWASGAWACAQPTSANTSTASAMVIFQFMVA
jgi:hypothetical protein